MWRRAKPAATSGLLVRSRTGSRSQPTGPAVVVPVLGRRRGDVDAVAARLVYARGARGVIGLDGDGRDVAGGLVTEVRGRVGGIRLGLVVVVVGEVGLLQRRQVAGVALRLSVIALLTLVQ